MRSQLTLAVWACCGLGCFQPGVVPLPAGLPLGGARILVVESRSGVLTARTLEQDTALLADLSLEPSLHLVAYSVPLETLGLSAPEGVLELAPPEEPPPQAEPLPPGWTAYVLRANAWEPEAPSEGPLPKLRLRADPCPALGQEDRFTFEPNQPVHALLPLGPGEELVLTAPEAYWLPEAHIATYVLGSTLARRPSIERAIARTSTAISNPAGFRVGSEQWMVADDGALFRFNVDGSVEAKPLRFPRHSHLLAAAGNYDAQHRLEVFALTRFVRADDGGPLNGELFHLRPGGAQWEATHFPDGAPRLDCNGNFAFTSLELRGPGVVRFTFEGNALYTYDAVQGRFERERIGDGLGVCAASVHLSPRYGELMVLHNTAGVGHSVLYQRAPGGWTEILADDRLTHRGFAELGGELFVVGRMGALLPLRIYPQQGGPPLVGLCPAQLAGGQDISVLDHDDTTVWYDQGLSDQTRLVGRAQLVDPAASMVPDPKDGAP
ncbi:MAG: hypothetical protein U1E65_21405 [Myxococcota bacterium]